MKTNLILTIETPDNPQVWEDYEKDEEDYTPEELKSFREKFAKELHETIKDNFLENMEEVIEDQVMLLLEGSDTLSIDSWDSLEDYGIKIKVEEQKQEVKKER